MSSINSNEPGRTVPGQSYLRSRAGRARISWFLSAALLVAGALWIGRELGKTPRVVHAQFCNAGSLVGTYGYTQTGVYFDAQGGTNYYSAAGSFVADGQGNLSGSETSSDNGNIATASTYTGTYTINTDCSGSYSSSYPGLGFSNYTFVITDSGNGIQLIESDTGINLTGVARRQ
jgi:hypothetical protein